MDSRRAKLVHTSWLNDHSVLNRFANGIGADRKLGYVTPEQVERWFVAQTNQKPSSYNKIYGRVKGFLVYCQRHGWVREDLMVDVGTMTVPRMERFRLAPDQLVAFLDVVSDPRERALIAVCLNTALRSSEVTALRIKDVDLSDRELYVVRQKSKSDDRLKITPALDRELRQWLTIYANSLNEPLNGDMYLFPARRPPHSQGSPDGYVMVLGSLRPYARLNKPHSIVQRALRDFGVEVQPGEGVHTLRRSVARAFFDLYSEKSYDGTLRATAALLGHKSTATTELYLGIDGDRRRRDQMMSLDFLPFDQGSTVVSLRAASS